MTLAHAGEPAPPGARSAAEREILTAAAELFSERGFEGASLDAVAQRLGSTKGRVYHYFRSKTELFCILYQDAMDRLEGGLSAAAEATPGAAAEARLQALCEAHVLALLEDREAHRVGMIGLDAARRAAARAEDRAALEGLRARQEAYEARLAGAVDAARREGAPIAPPDAVMLKTLLLALNGCLFFNPMRAEIGATKDAATRRAFARRIARQGLYGVLGGTAAATAPSGRDDD